MDGDDDCYVEIPVLQGDFYITISCVLYHYTAIYITVYIFTYIGRNRSKPVWVTKPLEIKILMISHGLDLSGHTMLGGIRFPRLQGRPLEHIDARRRST